MTEREHRRLILDQFTRQAAPFSELPAHTTEVADRLLTDLAQVGPADDVLDVACGPGLVACTLAATARQVGVSAHRKEGSIHFSFPLVLLVGVRL